MFLPGYLWYTLLIDLVYTWIQTYSRLQLSGGLVWTPCFEVALDPLGHHAISCKQGGGGDVVTWQNHLRNVFARSFSLCRFACPVRIEMGSEVIPDHNLLISLQQGGKEESQLLILTSLLPLHSASHSR